MIVQNNSQAQDSVIIPKMLYLVLSNFIFTQFAELEINTRSSAVGIYCFCFEMMFRQKTTWCTWLLKNLLISEPS